MRAYLAGACFSIVFLGAGEAFWRSRGFTPSVQDTAGLWDMLRHRASSTEGECVVLLGSSRTLLAINPLALAESLPGTLVLQLAIDGSSPLPVLRDLATDNAFDGTVVCEVAPTMFFDPSRESERKSLEWVRHYHQRSRISDVETQLRLSIQRSLVIVRPELNPVHMVSDVVAASLPRPGYTTVAASRFRFANFQLADSTQLAERWEERFTAMGKTPTPEEVASLCAEIAESVRAIRRRGGDVVFVRLPSSGDVARVEEERFPRALCWDQFARVSGIIALDCDKIPLLSGYACPDDSHLDGRDSERFSLAFGRVLRTSLGWQSTASLVQVSPER